MFNNLTIKKDTVRSYARGIAGGLLFGMPLIFTMEMWWLGLALAPEQLILALIANFGILLILEHYSGFREDSTFIDEVQDAVVAQGLGMIVSVLMLWLINILRPDMSLFELVGKVVMQTIAISIGISLSMSLLGDKEEDDDKKKQRRIDHAGFWGNQAIALAGAIFLALNVAATEEPTMIGLQMQPWQSLSLLVLSVLLVFAITYALEFGGGIKHNRKRHWGHVLLSDSVATWATAFLCAAGILLLFGRIDMNTSLMASVQIVVCLTFATSLGAAAARILI